MTTMTSDGSITTVGAKRVWRVEVHPKNASDDPVGASVKHEAEELGVCEGLTEVRSASVYLIQTSSDQDTIDRIASELLTDPICERYRLGSTPREEEAAMVEVHFLPGVTDQVADSTEGAIREMLGNDSDCVVRTGKRYDLFGVEQNEAVAFAKRALANSVIQSISGLPEWPQSFVEGHPYEFHLTHVPIRDLDDAGLERMSRESHLFLSLEEMQAVKSYYLEAGREPTDVELETLAQTWSEHCVHKTLKSKVSYRESGDVSPCAKDWANRPGHSLGENGELLIDNILKSTIAAATHELRQEGVDWCISVFVDNAGIIAFDEADAVTFKVETHNRPSAIEPYGGAATGIGGCIRDTMGTGLSAKPIANTDVFAVADPDYPVNDLPSGVLHPRRILKQVVAGVRDYGNQMGIPTVNGSVWFDNRYLGNPLVFAGSVGLIPNDLCFGEAQAGDRILAIGGRTGRDGIHGATFSSAELTETHADEFSHAVQIGNPIMEKKALDVILQARDYEEGCLYSAITDCGAGGFSSAIGEMGEEVGACVELDRAPLKYDGLSYTEIWISEAQERMVLAAPAANVDQIRDICEAEDVEVSDLGEFGTENRELVLKYGGKEVGRLGMGLLHDGIPQPTREAMFRGVAAQGENDAVISGTGSVSGENIEAVLKALVRHPNVASKHWIIRQYDHEVQGGSVIKPLVGPGHDGPSDAAVLRPKLDSDRGIALSNGLATNLGDADPYWMTLAAIDEAVRNAVCVGARPDRVAVLDNFCWAKCDRPENLGGLVRAAEACYDGAKAYRTPFISGKDSLNNEFTMEDGTVIAIPPTLLISAIGIVDDVTKCVTMDSKAEGNLLIQVGVTRSAMGGSHFHSVTNGPANGDIPRVDITNAPEVLAEVARLIAEGVVRSAHDCSEGGMLVAAAEMAFSGGLGLNINIHGVPRNGELGVTEACFAETPTRILLEVEAAHFDSVARSLRGAGVPFGQIGTFTDSGRLYVRHDEGGKLADICLREVKDAWLAPLDW